MKFDEAIEELRLAIPEKFYSPTMHDIAVMLEVQTKVINLLREEYAPTVEMTSGNKATFIQEGDSLSKLLTGYFGFDVLYWGDISERKVAQAWLHPETIKVVDE